MASFPNTIFSYTASVDYETVADASIVNNLSAEIVAIEQALGQNPATVADGDHVEGTVGYNIDVLYSDITTLTSEIASLTSGTLTSITATNTSIVVSTTSGAATIHTNTLDVIATQEPPAANWSNNSHKITSLANGASAQDAAAFGQIPLAGTSTPAAVAASGVAGSAATWAPDDHAHAGIANVTSGGGVTVSTASAVATIGPVLPRASVLTVSGSTYTPNWATQDLVYIFEPSGNFTIANPSNIAAAGQKLLINIYAVSAYSISWGGTYYSSGLAALPTACVAGRTINLGFIYDAERGVTALMAFDGVGY